MENERYARGHNWELLRQYADAQGLYFEPLKMSDGEPRLAMVWAAPVEKERFQNRQFESRFLNFKNPGPIRVLPTGRVTLRFVHLGQMLKRSRNLMKVMVKLLFR